MRETCRFEILRNSNFFEFFIDVDMLYKSIPHDVD